MPPTLGLRVTRIHFMAMTILIAAIMTSSYTTAALAQMSQPERGLNRPGQDYHSFQVKDWVTCSSSCGSQDKCYAYTFVRPSQAGGNGTCWLKAGVPTRKADQCCISGVRIMSKEYINLDKPGYDLRPGYNVNLSSQCRKDCQRNPKCKAWTFVKPGYQGSRGKCWLKRENTRGKANNCCISGARLRTSGSAAQGSQQLSPGN